MEKEWRIIKEAPNYEVSNYGDVRNIKTGRCLAGSVDKDGYPRVQLGTKDENGKSKKITRFRHRLAAEAFLPNPNGYKIINHKDETRDNSYVGCAELNYEDSNLEWCTVKYNNNYGTCQERRIKTLCEYFKKNGGRPIKPGKPVNAYDAETNELIGEYASITEAARELNCDYRSVYKIVNKQEGRKTHHGMTFNFVS